MCNFVIMNKIRELKIGNLKLKNPLFLAPMVDVTDLAYRILCRRTGAAIGYTEMLQAEALIHGGVAIKKKVMTNNLDKPVGIQITGRRIDDFEKIMPKLRKFDLVDLNCGCPSHLTVVHGSGSYLLKTPEKIAKVIKMYKDNNLTVTSKIRLGFNKNNVLKISKQIERAGADALTVHARLATDKRNIPADWKWFSKIKDKLGIPIIGNGDVTTPQKAEELLEVCDGVMIARAAIGNPLIFENTLHYLKTGKEKEFDYKKNLKLYLEYLKLLKKYDLVKMSNVKYIGGKFLSGFPNAAEKRFEFMKLKDIKEIEKFVKGLIQN